MKKNIIVATCAVLPVLCFAKDRVEEEKPNFLLFISDDCTYRDLGCYGSQDAITPNIDKFAKEGMMFSKAYQAVPMSGPTRNNLYSGLWPQKSGAYPNHSFSNNGNVSIVHHLKPLGYKVALIGKSHVFPVEVYPFDLYVPRLAPDNALDFDSIERFIKECEERNVPYCLYVCTGSPHSPWTKGDQTKFSAEKLTLPPIYVDVPETRENYRNYLAEINHMDGEFGRVLGILDDKGDKENTMVTFLSEQGNSFPFSKWTCYDIGVHSAMLVRYPKKIKANTQSNALVEYIDVVPTYIDMAGGSPVAPIDGRSFKEVLLGKKEEHKKYTFSIQTTRGIKSGSQFYGVRAVCDGQYRYILNLTPTERFRCATTLSDMFKAWEKKAQTDEKAKFLVNKYQYRPQEELYDVNKDPYCMNNLIEDKELSSKRKEFSAELKKWMDNCGDLGNETELNATNRISKVRVKKIQKEWLQLDGKIYN